MSISRLFGVTAVALVASFANASAQERLQVGVLECAGGPNVGYVIGSTTELECVFKTGGRRADPYVARVQRIGLDLGFTQNTGVAWAVYAPTRRIGPGDLSGSYGGVGANASFGVGVGGNLLVGGSANSFALQPLSLQGQTGLNATAGIVDVQLRPADFGPQRKYRKHKRNHRQHR
ncbi:DUF992 domain-containing protein [Rhodopseudomonas pseudopalustris]|uniref:DUF992 domain-containing protein n=2 Tax=Rhodopseudomonas TaxID=1073 RepID=Q131U4_RHOPS|nr:DUF992 domain-containing protein [Rhodopseudomonas pseudopalustris]ABE41145.1 protein of unknown function DUF992 [Rhodopseudomonas palustris BisB5]MBB1092750.1 DUF992 domain-containing protein [Rhodopseudomonas palustris]SEP30481.1 Protein of unknown function [Rhodopseudomonas pseudopalustris]